MKLHFEHDLDYQLAAIDAVTDLFAGQDICRTEFTVSKLVDPEGQQRFDGMSESTLGIGNRLQLLDDEILDNLKKIQIRSGLRPSDSISSGDFTIEMETGTGKTYVYLRTIFELNKRFGFTKFVIVVPSVAIKEGVYKNLQITREHFENLYPVAKGYDYFLYDSGKPGQVRDFATNNNIRIMVTTVGAINKKDVNNLYKENEKTGGEKPIDLVKATKPIIIVDEPQSVDGGLEGRGKQALEAMEPLCTLRYSATHVDKHHMVYKLDAVDAYEKKLVKQIEIASVDVEGGYNRPFVKLLSTHNKKGAISAKIEIDIESNGHPVRQIMTVEDGDSLEERTDRSIYENFLIGTITCGKNNESMILRYPGGEKTMKPGDEHGGVNQDDLKRLMIQRTIREHFDKELSFAAQKRDVKVLSLFFIDTVEHYRSYDENGYAVKGKYAVMFEEEYRKLAADPKYNTLFESIDLSKDAAEVHNGYFAIDKKVITPFEEVQFSKSTSNEAVDTSSYNLIMKDKERLLSFETKLKFIFSHSALREGWDNPNVFQICTLRDMGTERERRQTIGRGLRLCVNQQGERLRGFDINRLTVIANESYEKFAENLQKEIEDDTGIRFGIVEKHQFAALPVLNDKGEIVPLGVDESEKIWDYLRSKDFIDNQGRVKDDLRRALKDKTFVLPAEYKDQATEIESILRKLAGKLDVKNANDREKIKTREAVLNSKEFKELWDRIKHKTTYRVEFDNKKLIDDCVQAVKTIPAVTRTKARFRKAELSIGQGGVETNQKEVSQYHNISEKDIVLPDVITDLQDKTQLTRQSIVKILTECNRLPDFKLNPQEFIEYASIAINKTKQLALVDGIKYQRIGDNAYWGQELFQSEELMGYLENNTLKATKSVYEYVVYDSGGVERSFAEDLEQNTAVKVYAKLPGWFKIPTPLGTYNPDWAILVEVDNQKKLYFVVETKGSVWWQDHRHKEGAKIECGKRHFEAICVGDEPAQYVVATTVDDVMKRV